MSIPKDSAHAVRAPGVDTQGIIKKASSDMNNNYYFLILKTLDIIDKGYG